VRIISSSSLDVRDTGAVEVVFLMVAGAGLARVEVAVVVIGLRMAATVAGRFGMVDDARVLGGDGLEGARDDAVERAATVGSRLVIRGAMLVVLVVVREGGTPGVFFDAKLTAERARAIGRAGAGVDREDDAAVGTVRVPEVPATAVVRDVDGTGTVGLAAVVVVVFVLVSGRRAGAVVVGAAGAFDDTVADRVRVMAPERDDVVVLDAVAGVRTGGGVGGGVTRDSEPVHTTSASDMSRYTTSKAYSRWVSTLEEHQSRRSIAPIQRRCPSSVVETRRSGAWMRSS
jgi:hypothetical protein